MWSTSMMTTLTVNELRMQLFDTLRRGKSVDRLRMGIVACLRVRRRSL